MTSIVRTPTRVLIVAAVALAMIMAVLVQPGPANATGAAKNVTGARVQSAVNNGNAAPGNTGWILVSFHVSSARTQQPKAALASSVGTGAGAITMPSNIVFDDVTVPPGGCALTPTQFSNAGSGVYNLRLVPFTGNTSCKWNAGEYVHEIHIKNGAGKIVGSALVEHTID